MPQEYKLPTALETLPADYWFPKFVISGLLLISVPLFFDIQNPNSGLVCAFILFISLVMMSLTRVKPEAEKLMYRRFFRWKSIDYSDIARCKTFWILGYIKPKQYIFPWGGMCFVLPRDTQYDYRWNKSIIGYICNKAGISPDGRGRDDHC